MRGDKFNQIKLMMSISEKVNPLYMDDGYYHFQAIPKITPILEDSLDINFLISEGELVEVKVTDIKWDFTKVKEDADGNQDASTKAERPSREKA